MVTISLGVLKVRLYRLWCVLVVFNQGWVYFSCLSLGFLFVEVGVARIVLRLAYIGFFY